MNQGKLLLVRHGQTHANVDQVWHGHTDTPLNELGHQQAERLGEFFHNYLPQIHAIYSSPLQRARHTAERIGLRQLGERAGEWRTLTLLSSSGACAVPVDAKRENWMRLRAFLQ